MKSSQRGGIAIADLVASYGLATVAADQLARFAGFLVHEPHAPIATRDFAGVVSEHLSDSLVALEVERVRRAATLVDVGSGAGLPGLPLAIALPDAEITLLESNGRKSRFLEAALAEADIRNASVVNARAESWQAGLERFDIATARALAPLEVVVEYGAPLLSVGGALIVWRGRRDPEVDTAARDAAVQVGLELEEVRRVQPFPEARQHHLYLFSKVRPTPSSFPRRPGLALKRPLGRPRR